MYFRILTLYIFIVISFALSSCNEGFTKKESEQIYILKRNLRICETQSREIDGRFRENMEDFGRRQRTQKWDALQVKLFPFYKNLSMDSGNNRHYVDSINFILDSIRSEYKNNPYYERLSFQLKKINNPALSDSIDYLFFKTDFIGKVLEMQELLSENISIKPIHCDDEYHYLYLPRKTIYQSNENIVVEWHPLCYARKTFRNYCSLYKGEQLISKQILTEESPFFKHKPLKKGQYRLECKGYEIFKESQNTIDLEEPSVQSAFLFEVK